MSFSQFPPHTKREKQASALESYKQAEAELITKMENSATTTKKRVVRFQERTFFRQALHLDDFTNEEHESTWFSGAELKRILKREKLIIKTVQSQRKGVSSDILACNGLESHDARKERRTRMTNIYARVFLVQAMYRDNDKETAIAESLEHITRAAAARARNRALQQEKTVQVDLLKERSQSDRRVKLQAAWELNSKSASQTRVSTSMCKVTTCALPPQRV